MSFDGDTRAGAASSGPAPDVLMLPDFSLTNPYQWELMLALAAEGVRATLTNGFGDRSVSGAVEVYGRPKAVHLHWIAPFVPDDSTLGAETVALVDDLAELRRQGTRIVWTVHNLYRHSVRHIAAMRTVRRRIIELAHVTITHCSAAKSRIMQEYELDAVLADRIRVVPHGHYLDAYPTTVSRSLARASLGLEQDDFVFLFLGQLRAYKGLSTLIDAFASLKGDGLRLVVAGRAHEQQVKDDLRARAAHDPRLVLHVGHVPDERIQVYMNAADVVVLPYLDIFTSGGAILAMSFGRPVVGPAIGCLPETLPGDANVLYEPGHPHALGDAMRTALTIDAESAGERNRQAAELLDWRPIAAATRRAYGLPVEDPAALARRQPRPSPWELRAERAAGDLARILPEGEVLAVLDEETLRHEFGCPTVPFPGRDGHYGGAPAKPWDAANHIADLRSAGIRYFAVLWPAFWWFDAYPSLRLTLDTQADRVLQTDQLELFRLRTGTDASSTDTGHRYD